MIVESFLELRYVDKTAFENVQWTNCIPHVQTGQLDGVSLTAPTLTPQGIFGGC